MTDKLACNIGMQYRENWQLRLLLLPLMMLIIPMLLYSMLLSSFIFIVTCVAVPQLVKISYQRRAKQ